MNMSDFKFMMEGISPEDLILLEEILDEMDRLGNCRTYDFNITSDSVPQWEETLP